MASLLDELSYESDRDEYRHGSDATVIQHEISLPTDNESSCADVASDASDTSTTLHSGDSDDCDYGVTKPFPRTRSRDDCDAYAFAHFTKNVVVPSLSLIFVVAIFFIILICANFSIDRTVDGGTQWLVKYTWHNNSDKFDLSFTAIIALSLSGSVLAAYTSHKWASMLPRLQMESARLVIRQQRYLLRSEDARTDIFAEQQQMQDMLQRMELSQRSDEDLEAMADKLFWYKHTLLRHKKRCKYRHQKQFLSRYINEVEQQYDDIQQLISANQMSLLMTILNKVSLSPRTYVDVQIYTNCLDLCNVKTKAIFTAHGGFKAMHKINGQQMMLKSDLEQLIQKVSNTLEDDHGLNFVNY